MAGNTSARELGLRFAIAGRGDDAPIRRLLRGSPMAGAIDLSFEREPDYFRGEGIAGGCDTTIVAYRDSELVCMGRSTRRECWIDRRPATVGYLAELRLHPEARGQFRIVRDGYEFFRELESTDPADVYFTSIASDNTRARRLLESGRRGLPRYEFLAELVTLLIDVPRRPTRPRGNLERPTTADLAGIARLLNSNARNLALVWNPSRLEQLALHGLSLDQFLVLRDGGQIIAAGALWDQRSFRQIVVRGYSGLLVHARPVVNLASTVLGMPRLPDPGSTLAHGYLAPLGFASGEEALLTDLIDAFVVQAAESSLEYVTLALPANDSRLALLRRRYRTRFWTSRLYQVAWSDRPTHTFTEATFHPEVAFL